MWVGSFHRDQCHPGVDGPGRYKKAGWLRILLAKKPCKGWQVSFRALAASAGLDVGSLRRCLRPARWGLKQAKEAAQAELQWYRRRRSRPRKL